MKHLKKYKTFGSSLMMKLSKEELDKMNEIDINDYRSEFIQRNNQESDFDQYLDELELYREIRFDYNRKFLQKLLDKHDSTRIPKSTDDKVEDLLVRFMRKDGGFEQLVNGKIEDLRKKVGNAKYILGL